MNLWSEILGSQNEVSVVEIREQNEVSAVDLPVGAGGAVSELHVLRNHLSLDGGGARSKYGDIESLDGGNSGGNTSSV